MKKNLLFIGVAFLLLTSTLHAGDTEIKNMSLVIQNITWNLPDPAGYHPFDPTAYTLQVDIQIPFELQDNQDHGNNHHNDDEGKWYTIGFSKSTHTNSYNRAVSLCDNTLGYFLLGIEEGGRRDILKDFPNVAKRSEVLTGKFRKQDVSPAIQTFYIKIPANVMTSPGMYTDQFTLTLYEGKWSEPGTIHDRKTITFRVPVRDVKEIKLGENLESSILVDFGVIQGQERKQFGITSRSNTPYQVYVQSQNHQKLLPIEPGVSTFIDYTFRYNSTLFSLSSGHPTLIETSLSGTGIVGSTKSAKIRLAPLTNQLAGTYSDTLIFTLSDY